MALSRPTLQELRSRIEKDILARVTTGEGILQRSFINVLARVFAAVIHLTYGFIDWLSEQFLPPTATDYLDEHGKVWGLTRNPATFAVGSITPTGAPGILIPSGTVFKNADALEYTTDTNLTLPGSVAVTASTAGEAGNQDAGDILTLNTPILQVDDEATVDVGGLTGGGDIESDADYRERILSRIQYSPAGGTENDYVNWVLNYSGAFAPAKAWVFPLQQGPGTVQVYFMLADQVFPNATQIQAIQDELDKKAPVTADVTVSAPFDRPVRITMDLSPNTTTVQDAVKDSLESYFKDNADVAMTLLKSQLDEAISLATGEVDHTITQLEVDFGAGFIIVPLDNINFADGELPTLDKTTDVLFN